METELTSPLKDSINQQKLENNIEKQDIKPLPSYYTCSFIMRPSFEWMNTIIYKANKKQLKTSDVSGLSTKDKAMTLVKPLEDKWYGKDGKNGYVNEASKNAFFLSIVATNYMTIIVLFFLNLIISSFKYIQIAIFFKLTSLFENYINNKTTNKSEFYLYGASFILIKFIKTFAHHQIKFQEEILGERTINQVTALLYEKVTKSSVFMKSQISEGEILNFIQVDADSLKFLYSSVPKIIASPFDFGYGLYKLFSIFGFSFLGGFGMLVISFIIIAYVQKVYLSSKKAMLYKKDTRMRLTTHTFHILKILKLFGWEDKFISNIKEKRNNELYYMRSVFICTAIRSFINSIIPFLITISSYIFQMLLGNAMKISQFLSVLTLMKEISVPVKDIPEFITNLLATMVSMERIQNFLKTKDCVKHGNTNNQILSNSAIKIVNTDFGIINENDSQILLKNLNLDIPKGKLVSVIGETGCGKTCLINAILGNLEIVSNTGDFNINGTISYANQDPWIMNGTIRDNIIYYSPFDSERYNKVLKACQLDTDIDNLKHGDMTEIGSNGTNISGGQRARISMARAIYKDVDIYLFDDPISCVDTYVSMQIFKDAILNVLKGKTVIFVTHDVRNLQYFDQIICLEKFEITFNGNYQELVNEGIIHKIIAKKNEQDINKNIITNNKQNISEHKEIKL